MRVRVLPFALLLVFACRPGANAPSSPVAASSAAPKGAVSRVLAWLECEECQAGELDAVVELGEPVVALLEASLRDGVAPATRAELRRQLEERAAAEDALGRPWVERHLRARDALHRVRAATALGAIGGERATTALRTALGQDPVPSVRRALRQALGAS